MKKDYMTWNKDTVDDEKIAADLQELSEGKLQMTDDIMRLMAERLDKYFPQKTPSRNFGSSGNVGYRNRSKKQNKY